MSLDPHWYSTIFGFIFIVGECLSAMCLMFIVEGILVRYEKKGGNYLGLIQMACGLFWYRRLHRMGRCDATQNTT